MNTVLDVKKLNVCFKLGDEKVYRAVYNSSFQLKQGEVLSIVGESGSGKSVTALSIMGLINKNKILDKKGDEIIFAGQNLKDLNDEQMQQIRGNKISMIFQEPLSSLNPLKKIGEQISEVIIKHKKTTKLKAKARSRYLLKMVGIKDYKERLSAYPFELSGGERQRVMIAMAIANKPKILIADEPTTALDVTIQAQILDLLLSLKEKLKMSIIFISHDLRLVKNISNRVIVMKDGVIVEQASVGNIFHAPSHPYTKQLLSAFSDSSICKNITAKKILEAKNIQVSYPIKKNLWGKITKKLDALNKASITLYEGKTLGVVGQSGSGKSTLGLCLANLIKYQGNVLTSKLLDIQNEKSFRKNIQIIFQDPYSSLNPRMNIYDIINESLYVHYPNLSKKDCTRKIIAVLNEVGLKGENILYKYPHEFSGGERQRINIARSLVIDPKIMILDEPTSALDVTIQVQILDLLKKLQRKHKISMLFISHDMRAVKYISHEIIVMKQGDIVEYTSSDKFFVSPKNEYAKELIAASL